MNRKVEPSLTPTLRRALALCAVAIALGACSRELSAQSNSAAAAAPSALAAADPTPPTATPAPPPGPAPGAQPEPAPRGLPDFSQLVDRYGPAVVNVEVVEKAQPGNGGPQGLSPNDPFYDFFRRFGIPGPGEKRGSQPPARGAGSGFIINSDGYILTNTHVVENADEVTVRLTDRREFPAKVIGADDRTDVAVIKINATNLPIVKLGDPARIRPGQWVLAIGSPFGFENSATAGIISATSRSVPGENNYVPFIQTDVAVNPGNSGGPLFNMAGDVIGINSQIFSRTGGFMGVSFAIPIDVARNVEEQLIKTGRVVRGRIGVTIQDVNAQLAESFGLARPRGALVSSVEKDGPAAQAGVLPGDVILSVGGHPIERYGELSGAISAMRPGSEASLTVWREGKERSISVKVAELKEPQQAAARSAKPAPHGGDRAGALGLTVRPLAPAEKEQANTQGSLVVEEVTGPAQAAEVEPGDIILGINGKRVHTVKELQDATQSSGKNVALLIQRGDAQIFVPLRLP
jgi:serine protease Do